MHALYLGARFYVLVVIASVLLHESCTLNTHPVGHRIDPGPTIVGTKPAPPYVAGAQGNADE